MRKFLSLFTTAALAAQLFVVMGAVLPAQAAIPECSASMTAQNDLKVAPGHGQVFYVDTGLNPKLDSAYVAYKVTNTTGSQISPFVVLDNFSGGNVSLANPLDASQQIINIPNAQAKTAFFLLKSAGGTTTKQSHIVRVYATNPAVSGTALLLECSFTFQKVVETIKARANKITSIAHTYSSGINPTIGGTITTTVKGEPGQIGAGSSPDFSAFWASPAAFSTWPTRSLRLESTQILLNCTDGQGNQAGTVVTLTNELFKGNVDTCFTKTQGATWTGKYVFRIIGPAAVAPTPSPVAQISSGVKYKHSDVDVIPNNNPLTKLSEMTVSGVVVQHSGAVSSASPTTVTVRYTTTISSTVNVIVDELFDQQVSWSGNVSYVTGSSTRNGTSLSDEVNLSSERLNNPPLLRFFGPITVASNAPVTYTYEKTYVCGTSAKTAAFAKVGDTTFGSENYALASASLVSSTTGSGDCVATVETTTQQLDPLVRTDPASDLTTTGAQLKGLVDPYGLSPAKYRFSYATNPNLISPTTTAETALVNSSQTAVSQSITGLQSGTTYYYRVELVAGGKVYQGAILSFRTLAVQAIPVVTTLPATSITVDAGSINGEIDLNLTTVTEIKFEYSTNSSMVSPTTTSAIITDPEGITQADKTVLSGDGLNEFTTRLTGLASETTYYFRIVALCATGTFCPGGVILGNVLSFTTGAPTVTTEPATNVGATGASVSSVVNFGTNVAHQFIYCESETSFNRVSNAEPASCSATTVADAPSSTSMETLLAPSNSPTIFASLSGLNPGKRYFYVAVGADTANVNLKSFGLVLYFDTLQITTTSLPDGTKGVPYQQAISGTGGSGNYVWSLAVGSLPPGLTLGSNGVISGTPTANSATPYSFTVEMYDPTNGTRTQQVLSITIGTPTLRTVTYDYQGGAGTPPSEQVAVGASIALPAAIRDGFILSGWKLSTLAGALVDNPYSPVADVTLVASWSPAVTITFDSNFGSATTRSQIAIPGNIQLEANAFSHNGYSFAGWATSRTGPVVYANSATDNFVQNITLYARWNSLVTYDYNGGTGTPASATVLDGSSVSLAVPNSRANFDFNGWTVFGAPTVLIASPYTPNGNVTLVASWSSNVVNNNNSSFTITFDGNYPSSGQQTQTANAGSVTLNNNGFTRSGWTFEGWATSPTGAVVHLNGSQIQLSGNLTLYAVWTEIPVPGFIVTFNPGFTGVNSVTQSIPVSGNLRANPFTLDGFLFSGWATTPGGRVVYSDMQAVTLTGNLDLYGIWAERAPALDPYRVTYTSIGSDGGRWPDRETSPSKFFHTVRDNISLTKKDHRFGGWYNFTNPSVTYKVGDRIYVETNLRLAPIWLEVSRAQFTNQLSSHGTGPAPIEGFVGQAVILPTELDLKRKGHDFVGWRNNASQPPIDYRPGTQLVLPSGGVVLDPIWQAVISYELTLDPGNGAPIRIIQLDPNGPALPLTPPTRDGYKFQGWYDAVTGLIEPGPVEPNSNRKLIARWIEIFKVTLDFNGVAPGIQELPFVAGDPAITPPTPVRPGYNFLGWLIGPSFEQRVAAPIAPTGNLTLRASWELITFKVTLQHFSDSSKDLVLEYAPGGSALDLPRWVRQSFQLRGWTPSETGLTPFFGSFVPTGDSTLYTSWTLKRTIFFGGDSSRLTPAATRTLTQVAALLSGANQTLHVSTVGWVKETANKDIDARLSRDRAVQTNAFLRRSLQFATATAVGRGIFGIDSPISRRAELTVIVTGARKS